MPTAQHHPATRLCAQLLSATVLAAVASAQDWPNWRGPNHDGSSAVEGLPTDFDTATKVRWSTELPGPGASTPVVVGERIFLSSTDPETRTLIALCLDRNTGAVLWRRDASSGYQPEGAGSPTVLHDRSNYASPSACVDESRVFFFFGNGDLVAYDQAAGDPLWRKNIQKEHGDFSFQWTFSASPTLWEGRLFLPVLQRNEPVNGRGAEDAASFLLALDPESGALIYKHERPSDARTESLESYATAIPHVGSEGRKELLIVGGDVITGHDPASGRELWRWGTWNEGHREIWWRLVPSVVVGDGLALVCAPKRAPVYAVHLGGEGELGEKGLAWKSGGRPNRVTSDVPTPLYYQGAFFVLSDVRNALSRLKPSTGEIEWSLELPGRSPWRSSPTGADGKLWCMNHAGLVIVVDAESGKIVHKAEMGEEDDDHTRSSLVAAHGALFVRTNSTLFCIAAD